jgi:hypothetical protein
MPGRRVVAIVLVAVCLALAGWHALRAPGRGIDLWNVLLLCSGSS